MLMFICTITNLNTNACDQNKLILKIFVSYLQLLIMNISFVSMTCISHRQACFSKVFQLLLKKSCSHGHIFIHQKNMCLCNVKNSMVYCFYARKDIGVE
jgi:hypothetical protein